MRRVIPSRLVVVRHYRGHDAAGPASVAAGDRQLLVDAGIEAHVKHDRAYGIVLMVPGKRVSAATEVLRSSPNLFPEESLPACPRCHAKHPAARAPYGLLIVVVGFASAFAAVLFGYTRAGVAVIAVVVATAAVLESRLPRWRCRSSGERYGGPSTAILTD